jgi:hypothetical protein
MDNIGNIKAIQRAADEIKVGDCGGYNGFFKSADFFIDEI